MAGEVLHNRVSWEAHVLKIGQDGAGGMAQWLGALAALTEVPGFSVPT